MGWWFSLFWRIESHGKSWRPLFRVLRIVHRGRRERNIRFHSTEERLESPAWRVSPRWFCSPREWTRNYGSPCHSRRQVAEILRKVSGWIEGHSRECWWKWIGGVGKAFEMRLFESNSNSAPPRARLPRHVTHSRTDLAFRSNSNKRAAATFNTIVNKYLF